MAYLRAGRRVMGALGQDCQPAEPSSLQQYPISGTQLLSLIVALLPMLMFKLQSINAVVAYIVFLALVFLACKKLARIRDTQREPLAQLSFYLPLVVEELVMAVKAGHDILSALALVVRHAYQSNAEVNPVVRIFAQVVQETEQGTPFERSLRLRAEQSEHVPLRHTLMHLAVAHRDGGGLVYALSELADATQSFYEDSVEEEIASLPVKATLPLVVTFAGVLLLLMTPPIIQVIEQTLVVGVR